MTEELKQKLIDLKNDTNISDYECFEYFEVLVEKIIKTNDLNAQDKDGWTLLHYAVDMKNIEIIKLLIENGADINILDNISILTNIRYTPLDIAVGDREIEIVKLLIQYGANPNLHCKESSCTFECAKDNNCYAMLEILENAEEIRREFLNTHKEQKKKELDQIIEEDKNKTLEEVYEEAKEGFKKSLKL